jgi:uncharacterized membrane protein
MEWLIFFLRVFSVTCAAVMAVQVILAAGLMEPRLLWGALAELAIAAVAGYFGWWHFGNEEWRKT